MAEVILILAAFATVIMMLMLRYPSICLFILVAVPATRMLIITALPRLYTFSYLIEGFVILLVWIAGCISIVQGRTKLKPDKWWPYVAYLVAGCMAWVFLPASRADDAWKPALGFSLFGFLFFFAPLLTIHSMKDVRRLIQYSIIVGFAISCLMYFTGTHHRHVAAERITLGYTNPLHIASTAGILVVCLAGMLLASSSKRWKVSAIAIPFGLWAIYATGSRGELLMAVVTIMLLSILWMKHRPLKGSLVLMGILVAAVVFMLLVPSHSSRFSRDSVRSGVDVRLAANRIVLKNMISRAGIGYGPGDVEHQLNEQGIPLRYSHNAFLDVCNELGIIGGVSFLAIVIFSLRGMWRAAGTALTYEDRGIVLVLLGMNVFSLLLWFKTGTYYGNLSTHFLLGVGVIVPHLLTVHNHAVLVEDYASQEATEPICHAE